MIRVACYVNEGPGAFAGYRPGIDHLAGPVELELELPIGVAPAVAELAVAEEAFYVGNRQGPDAAGRSWPADVSSLSVGDVVVIGESAWSVASFGFDPVADVEGLRRSIAGGEVRIPRTRASAGGVR